MNPENFIPSNETVPDKEVEDSVDSGEIEVAQDEENNPILDRILRNIEGKNAYDALVDMKREDLTSLLLYVAEARANKLSTPDIFRQYKNDRFVQPSSVSQEDFVSFDKIATDYLSDSVDFVELSPVAVQGANSVLSPISQRKVISTIRNTEVMADTVTTLAIECAKRRSAGEDMSYLATSHREIRAQKFDEASGLLPHFRGLSLVSSEKMGYENEGKVSEVLEKHISFYLEIMKRAQDSGLVSAENVTVRVSSLRLLDILIRESGIDRNFLMENTQHWTRSLFDECGIDLPGKVGFGEDLPLDNFSDHKLGRVVEYMARIINPVFEKLTRDYPGINFEFDFERIEGLGYYEDLCIKIIGQNEDGENISLADGGFTDWTKKLLQDPKEKCFAGGFGSELFLSKFKKQNNVNN